MPFKSEAQRRKFYAMAARGEISQEMVGKWEQETPKGKKLPKRVKKAAATKKDVHHAADKAGIPWDDDPKFKRWSKKLTGKTCLDKMSPAQLARMKQAIKAKGMKKLAKAYTEQQRQRAKEKAIVLALQGRAPMALSRDGLRMYGIASSGKKKLITRGSDYNTLWHDTATAIKADKSKVKDHYRRTRRGRISRVKGHARKRRAAKRPTAVIIKGNTNHPVSAGVGDKDVSRFHGKLKGILESEGYRVSFDDGLPHTTPRKADVWVGHSRGADRLRFAPKGTTVIPVGSSRPNAVNHPADQKWMDDYEKNVLKGKDYKDVPVSARPPVPKEHFVVTSAMEKELRSRARAKGHVEQRAKERTTVSAEEIARIRIALRGRELRKGETYHYTWPGRGHAIIGDVGKKKSKHVVKTMLKPSSTPPGRRLTKIAVTIPTLQRIAQGLKRAGTIIPSHKGVPFLTSQLRDQSRTGGLLSRIRNWALARSLRNPSVQEGALGSIRNRNATVMPTRRSGRIMQPVGGGARETMHTPGLVPRLRNLARGNPDVHRAQNLVTTRHELTELATGRRYPRAKRFEGHLSTAPVLNDLNISATLPHQTIPGGIGPAHPNRLAGAMIRRARRGHMGSGEQNRLARMLYPGKSPAMMTSRARFMRIGNPGVRINRHTKRQIQNRYEYMTANPFVKTRRSLANAWSRLRGRGRKYTPQEVNLPPTLKPRMHVAPPTIRAMTPRPQGRVIPGNPSPKWAIGRPR